MNIFMVYHGEYSDRQCYFVASSRKNARKYIKAHFEDDDHCDIETVTIDYGIDLIKRGMKMYNVTIYQDGHVSPYTNTTSNDVGCSWFSLTSHNEPYLTVITWAKDTEHAIKIASEKRATLIALNRWPTLANFKGKFHLEAK